MIRYEREGRFKMGKWDEDFFEENQNIIVKTLKY